MMVRESGSIKHRWNFIEMINLSSGDTKISGYDKAFFKNLLNIDFEYTDPELSQIANYLEKVYNDNKTVSDADHVGWFRTVANVRLFGLFIKEIWILSKWNIKSDVQLQFNTDFDFQANSFIM